ncbi:uncharacterized protein [Battus philenor]|uniref:uncharacterized protein n=1 Tax=Battus philenor TaxID=42288 RepID=UPI0035CEB544
MAKKDKDNIYIPKYIEHKLDHCQQCFSWDCGIACVKMVLSSEQRDYMNKNFTKICQDEGFQQLTWTIDLCYLLKSRAFGGPYQGHYVIIVGCSGGKILYRDPALNSRLCAISPARLHAARRVTGTDFDVILIYK